jgi:hypothetical protein
MKPWKTWLLRVVIFALDHVKCMQSDLIPSLWVTA